MFVIKRMRVFLHVLVFSMTAGSAYAADTGKAGGMKLDDETARINYSLGYQIGGDFKRQNIEMNAEAVVKGIEDALSGAEPLMSRPDMHTTLTDLKRRVTREQRVEKRKSSHERELKHLAEGKKFLEDNAKKPGVKTTQSGLQYRILEPGTGKKPGPKDQVTVNYRGTMINGRLFDSSYERGEPSTFKLDGVIRGWTEGLQLIGEGGKITLFIPYKLAYRDKGPLGHRTLIFDIELLSVTEGGKAEAATGAAEKG